MTDMSEKEKCPKCGVPVAFDDKGKMWLLNADNKGNFAGMGHWADSSECLRNQLKQAKEIIDKLPKTADGVTVTPNMELYNPGSIELRNTVSLHIWQDGEDRSPGENNTPWGRFYSTKEAAEAAKGI